MAEKKGQMYCVVATAYGKRAAVSGPMDRRRAEQLAAHYNSQAARRRDYKYPKVAKYPYKEQKRD